ncbi:efflux RND transporter periplasmic adaptor subunit [Magnetococcales bacterium HHB-1]
MIALFSYKPLWSLILLVTLITGCQKEEPPVKQRIRSIKTLTISEKAAKSIRTFTGVVKATNSSNLSFQIPGNVREVNVQLGDRVKEGEVLALLDQKPFQLSVVSKEAALKRSQAEYREARLAFKRKSALHKKGWVSKAKIDQITARMQTAEGSVSYAQSQLDLAKRDLRHTTLKAPFDGTIAERAVDAFVDVRAGQKIFDINADGSMEIAFDIPETVINQIVLGSEVMITFAGLPNQKSHAKITEVSSVAIEGNAFPVRARLESPPPSVRSGMTAVVHLPVQEHAKKNLFRIPLSAVAPGKVNRQGSVFQFDPKTGQVKRIPIKLQGVRENSVTVLEGLKEGDIIAVAGVSFLHDGQKVRLLSVKR